MTEHKKDRHMLLVEKNRKLLQWMRGKGVFDGCHFEILARSLAMAAKAEGLYALSTTLPHIEHSFCALWLKRGYWESGESCERRLSGQMMNRL